MCFRVVPLSVRVTCVLELFLSRCVLRVFYSSSPGACYMCSRVVPLYVHITCVLELFLFRSCYMCSRVVPL